MRFPIDFFDIIKFFIFPRVPDFIKLCNIVTWVLLIFIGKGKKKEEKKQEKKQQPKKETPKKEKEPAEELDASDAALAAEPKSKDPFDSMPKG